MRNNCFYYKIVKKYTLICYKIKVTRTRNVKEQHENDVENSNNTFNKHADGYGNPENQLHCKKTC